MQRIVQSILSRLDMRLVRLSDFHRMYNDLAAAKLTIPRLEGTIGKLETNVARLEADLRLALELSSPRADLDRRSEAKPLLEALAADDGWLDPERVAAACAGYAELQSVEARESVSRTLLKSVATGSYPQNLLTDPALAELASHEVVRQLTAAIGYAEGHLAQAHKLWMQLGRDIPTPFNHVAAARIAIARGDMRSAYAILVEGVYRFPLNISLALEFAALFLRLGDTAGANAALEPVRHRFVEERNILAEQQVDLERAIAAERTNHVADHPHSMARRSTAGSHDRRSEYRNAQSILDFALRRLIIRLAESANITDVIEYGAQSRSSLAWLAREVPSLRFSGLSFDGEAGGNDSDSLSVDNLQFPIGSNDQLPADRAGSSALLIHSTIAGRSYPANLTNLYRQCAQRGLRHIVICEVMDFDRGTLRYHESGNFPRVTGLGGGGYLLHDFKQLLDAANYEIVESTFLAPTLMPEADELHDCRRVLHAVLRESART